MKNTLHSIHGLAFTAILFLINTLTAQINYTQDFSSLNHKWTTSDFVVTDVAVCNNPYALRAAYKNSANNATPAITYSPNLGVSNGERVVLTYRYKVLMYDEVLPYQPATGNNWGSLLVQYGPTQNGPWSVADNITASNHIPSDNCAVRKVAFTPANGTALYLKVTAGNGTDFTNRFYIYVDEVSALQDGITITSTFTESVIKVFPNPFTDYVRVEYPGVINNLSIFNNQGQAVNVDSIGTDYSRLDLTGLTRGNYTLKITGDDNTVSTINIEKKDVN